MENNEPHVTLDPERQEKAREYARIHRRLMLVELGWNALYALVWIFSGAAVGLRDWLVRFTSSEWLVVAGFVIVYGTIDLLLSLPLSWYSSFVLPHRYGLSTQSARDWMLDGLKGMLLGAPLGLLLVEVIYGTLRTYPQSWWLWAAGLLLLVNVLSAALFPTLIAPLFNKYVPLGNDHSDLEARLLVLADRAGTRVRGVYKFDMSRRTRAANAGLSGLGSTRRIVLGDTMIDEFSPDEIETVLAHELAHHVHADLPLGILFSAAVTLIGLFLAAQVLRWGTTFFGYAGISDVAALPLLSILLGLYGLVSMPLTNAFSRWRERMADEYALRMTGKGEAFASAMTRLANQNLSEVDPEPWVEFFLYSHPALEKRIALARKNF